ERGLGGQAQDAVLHARVDRVLEQQPGGPAFGYVPVQGPGPVEAAGRLVGCVSFWLHVLTVSVVPGRTHPQAASSGTGRFRRAARRCGVRRRGLGVGSLTWQAPRTP